MSEIMVNFSGANIDGESRMKGYVGQVECVAMRHAIHLPVTAQGTARTEAVSRHGAIELVHSIDKASPALRLAASAGTNLKKVKITRLRNVKGTVRPAEIISLNNVYVVRVDVDTPVDPLTNLPMDDVEETFSLEYTDIQWDYKYGGGSVLGSWSTANQETDVDV